MATTSADGQQRYPVGAGRSASDLALPSEGVHIGLSVLNISTYVIDYITIVIRISTIETAVTILDTSDAIAETLFGKTRRRVLGLLFGRPGESFYLRQIARLTSEGPGNVQRELKALAEAGLVTRDRQGKQVYFQANRDSPVFDELRRLMEKTTGLADQMRAALDSLQESGQVEFAFVFGSVATGEHTSQSDVDLMIIGDVRLSEIIPILRPVQDVLGREINPSIHSSEEFRKKLTAGEHFIGSVMKRPKLMIVGSKDELEELAG